MYPNKQVDLKIQQTGTAVVVRPVSNRAYIWMLNNIGADAPRGAGGEWLLRPDVMDNFLEVLPQGYEVFRGM